MWVSRKKYKELEDRIFKLEFENEAFFKNIKEMDKSITTLSVTVDNLEKANSKKGSKNILHG